MFKRYKSTKGITLVALVITIIILLILAGISISTLTNTGIFEKAKEAKQKSENAQKEEDRLISEYEKEIVKQDAEGIWDGKVNIPDLMSGMMAIKFTEPTDSTEGKDEKVSDSSKNDWYNYSEKKWANAKTNDGSMWVWIPRYAYRITYYSDSNYENVTGYYDGYGKWKVSGELCQKIDDGIKTVDYAGIKYIVHPAFETNLDNGGWDNELNGFWMAKFEASGSSASTLKFIYGVQSERDVSIGASYSISRRATYGYIGQKDKVGEYTSYMNSHLMKNSEWGAVVYLTHSKYGRNGAYVSANTSKYYTGGGTEITSYLSNTIQSSTGNVFGIYDLNGGSREYVAAFNSPSDYWRYGHYGWSGVSDSAPSTIYETKYNSVGKIGDATKEVTYSSSNSREYRWGGAAAALPGTNYPFLLRGGWYNDDYSGIFCGQISDGFAGVGNSIRNTTFRAVLCP